MDEEIIFKPIGYIKSPYEDVRNMPKSTRESGDMEAEMIINDSDRIQVTCVGCKFTYMAGNLVSVTAGSVPRGADIIVMADNTAAAAGGYSVNGSEFTREGKISFRLTVTENTEIKTK